MAKVQRQHAAMRPAPSSGQTFSLPADVTDAHKCATKRVAALLRHYGCAGASGQIIRGALIPKACGIARLVSPTGLIVDVGEYRVKIWHPRNDTPGRPRRSLNTGEITDAITQMERLRDDEFFEKKLVEWEIHANE